MRWFVCRLAAFAVAFVSMAAAMVATPGVSSAACAPNMSWNRVTDECKPPPPPPAWYVPRPAYAPSFAPPDIPPPPPAPWWAPQAPMWSTGYQQWGAYIGNVWFPF
jgi:hypothetical protein